MTVPAVEVPAGFTFSPKDEQLIEHYLGPKARGEQKFYLSHIPELDVYATEPWNLGSKFSYMYNLSIGVILACMLFLLLLS